MQSNALLKPRIIDVQSLSPVQARVTMEPFERGFGHTLGNALRRILLSSLPGHAATEVTIEGVLHEYSTLDGVREDIVDLVLNLKGVVFKLHSRNEAIVRLSKAGEGIVTAADIEIGHDVEIVNPEHVIAHIAPGGRLDMEIRIEEGRGYVPGNVRPTSSESKSIGRVVLDASFGPVRRVSYLVESARVEQRTDLDRLVFDIETVPDTVIPTWSSGPASAASPSASSPERAERDNRFRAGSKSRILSSSVSPSLTASRGLRTRFGISETWSKPSIPGSTSMKAP